MQNKPRKHMGIGLIAVSMLFLWNPDALAVFDLLPDVIGYILLSLGMSSLSYLNHHFDQSAKYFNRMIALSAARLVFVLVLFGLVSHFERPTTILLGNFVFGVLELMALLPVLLILSGLCVKENFCWPEPTIWNTRSRTCFCARPCWSGSRCIGTESV